MRLLNKRKHSTASVKNNSDEYEHSRCSSKLGRKEFVPAARKKDVPKKIWPRGSERVKSKPNHFKFFKGVFHQLFQQEPTSKFLHWICCNRCPPRLDIYKRCTFISTGLWWCYRYHKDCNILMYTDDTVIQTYSKNHDELEKKLCSFYTSRWMESNELVTNMKIGKTECMIFGTTQKVKKSTSISHIEIRIFLHYNLRKKKLEILKIWKENLRKGQIFLQWEIS